MVFDLSLSMISFLFYSFIFIYSSGTDSAISGLSMTLSLISNSYRGLLHTRPILLAQPIKEISKIGSNTHDRYHKDYIYQNFAFLLSLVENKEISINLICVFPSIVCCIWKLGNKFLVEGYPVLADAFIKSSFLDCDLWFLAQSR